MAAVQSSAQQPSNGAEKAAVDCRMKKKAVTRTRSFRMVRNLTRFNSLRHAFLLDSPI
jgi:hypothetical protein